MSLPARHLLMLAGPHPRSLALRRSKTRCPRAGRGRSLPALLLLAFLLASACTSSQPPEDPKDYVAEVTAARTAKDTFFMTGADSPVPEGRRPELLPLAYFPIDPDYKTAAVLRPAQDRSVIEMPTSTGGRAQMRRVGTLEFMLRGQAFRLTAFNEVGSRPDHLFVPFTDLTTGTETYAGGRFMDLDRNRTGIYIVDFNRAYFPYCYYSPTYECPFPPPENRLQTPLRAGERLKQSHF
jgi:hypothetical protein